MLLAVGVEGILTAVRCSGELRLRRGYLIIGEGLALGLDSDSEVNFTRSSCLSLTLRGGRIRAAPFIRFEPR